MSPTHLIEIGQTVEILIEQVDQDRVTVRLPDDSAGVIYRREWALDELAQSPDEVFKVGTPLRATVIFFHRDSVSWELSLRRVRVWEKASRRFRVGKTVRGRVVNVGSDRAYVQLMPGYDAKLPISEIPLRPDQSLRDALWIDDEVVGLIIDQNPEHLQITLSIRKYLAQAERIKAGVRDRFKGFVNIENDLDFGQIDANELASEDSGHLWISPIGECQIKRILVIDDDSEFHRPFAAGLRQMNYKVEVIESGYAGLDTVLASDLYDLVFLDVNLAGQNGVQVAQTILEEKPTLPVVLITAGGLRHFALPVDRVNVVDVVFKPVDLGEIKTLIQSIGSGTWRQRYTSAEETHIDTLASASLIIEQQNWDQTVKSALKHLAESTSATCALVLEMETGTERVRLVGQSEQSQLNETFDWNQARFSPVRDVIRDKREISEPDAKDDRVERRFRNLFLLCRFSSFIGLPVPALSQTGRYGLFLFHTLPQQFTERHLAEVRLAARSLALSIERQRLFQSVQLFQGFALAGQLGEGLMHEIGNQLTGLEQSARDLEVTVDSLKPEGALSGENIKDLREDATAVDRINTELRELTRFYLGLIRADYKVFDLTTLLSELKKRLRHLAREKQVEIILETESNLNLRTERGRLQQACLNIMLNAIQQIGEHRENGGLLVVTTKLGESADPYRVKIAFDDDGPGIHRQLIERIFEPGLSTRKDGTGLGLFICRNLVQSLGGKVSVKDSVLFAGTKLLIELPATLLEGTTL